MTVVLNLALLFTVLFFVYPLKFLFGVLLADPHMHGKIETPHGLELVVLPEHKPWIFVIFAIGYTAVFTVFWLLYRHAYRQREKLGLNEFEIFEKQHSMRRMLVPIIIGITYFGIAFMENMPKQTRVQKNAVVAVSFGILAVFAGLLVQLLRLTRERRRVKKDWLARPGEPPLPETSPEAQDH